MPKYLLLKHYRGGPEPHHPVPPMDQWAPEDVEAHMAFGLRDAYAHREYSRWLVWRGTRGRARRRPGRTAS
jgi:hypothetical protein